MHIRINLGIKFHLKLTVLAFWIKFLKIRISLGIKFHLKLTILIFWTKLAQKVYFRSKTKNVKSIIEFCIFKLLYVCNFDILDQISPEGLFLIENEKSEEHH